MTHSANKLLAKLVCRRFRNLTGIATLLASSVRMSREDANSVRSEDVCDDGSTEKDLDTTCEMAPAGSTRINLVPLPHWTLKKNRCECSGPMDVRCFGVKTENRNFSKYDWSCFERDAAWNAQKRRQIALSR